MGPGTEMDGPRARGREVKVRAGLSRADARSRSERACPARTRGQGPSGLVPRGREVKEAFILVTYGLNYEVRPGREAEFESKFGAGLDLLATVPGHHESRLYRDVRAPQSYLVYSEWDSREAFSAFLQSDAFNATKAWGREEILAARPQHTVFAGREKLG